MQIYCAFNQKRIFQIQSIKNQVPEYKNQVNTNNDKPYKIAMIKYIYIESKIQRAFLRKLDDVLYKFNRRSTEILKKIDFSKLSQLIFSIRCLEYSCISTKAVD